MKPEQQQQYMIFIMSFVRLMHEDGAPREATIKTGLSALAAFTGAVWNIPEDDARMEQIARFTAYGLEYAIDEAYGKRLAV